MFDDLKQNQDTSSDAPENLPKDSVGEPAMDKVQKSSRPVDDMFGDVDPTADKGSALQSGKLNPISQTQDPQMTATPQDLAMDQVSVDQDNGAKIKKIAAMAISILLLAAIATGVYVYFFSGNTTEQQVVEEEAEPEQQVVEEEAEPEQQVVEEEAEPEQQVVEEEKLDYDGDSLSNEREELLGTDPLSPDSDNDGVFDWDEVELYFTDPLEPDTDGDELNDYDELYVWGTNPKDVDTDLDGYGDGAEVANGYNPFGPGTIDDFVPPEKRILDN